MKKLLNIVMIIGFIITPIMTIQAQEAGCYVEIENGPEATEVGFEDITGRTDFEVDEIVELELEEGSMLEATGSIEAETMIELGMEAAAEEGVLDLMMASMAGGPETFAIGLAVIAADALLNFLQSEGIIQDSETYRRDLDTNHDRVINDLNNFKFDSMKDYVDLFIDVMTGNADEYLYLYTSLNDGLKAFEALTAPIANNETVTSESIELYQEVETATTISYFPQNMYINFQDLDGEKDKFSSIFLLDRDLSGAKYLAYLDNSIGLTDETTYSDENDFKNQGYLLSTYERTEPIDTLFSPSQIESVQINGTHQIDLKHQIVDLELSVWQDGSLGITGTSIGAFDKSINYPCSETQNYTAHIKRWQSNGTGEGFYDFRTYDQNICADMNNSTQKESFSFSHPFYEAVWIELRKIATHTVDGEEVLTYEFVSRVPYTVTESTLYDKDMVSISINDLGLSTFSGENFYFFVKSQGYQSTDYTNPDALWALQEFTLFKGPLLDYVAATNETSASNTHEFPTINTFNNGTKNSRDLLTSQFEIAIPNSGNKLNSISIMNYGSMTHLNLLLSKGLSSYFYQTIDGSLIKSDLDVFWLVDEARIGINETHNGETFEDHREDTETSTITLSIPQIPAVIGDVLSVEVTYEDGRSLTKSVKLQGSGGELDRAWYQLTVDGGNLNYSESYGMFSTSNENNMENSWLLEEWGYGVYTIVHEASGKLLSANSATNGTSSTLIENTKSVSTDLEGVLWHLSAESRNSFKLINVDFENYLSFSHGDLLLTNETDATTFGFSYYKDAMDIIDTDLPYWIQNRGSKTLLISDNSSTSFRYDESNRSNAGQQWGFLYKGAEKYAILDLRDSLFLSENGMMSSDLQVLWSLDTLSNGHYVIHDNGGNYFKTNHFYNGANSLTGSYEIGNVSYEFDLIEYTTSASLDIYQELAYAWYEIAQAGNVLGTAAEGGTVLKGTDDVGDLKRWMIEATATPGKYSLMNKQTQQAIGVDDSATISTMDWDPTDSSQYWSFYKDPDGIWIYNEEADAFWDITTSSLSSFPSAFTMNQKEDAPFILNEQDYLLLNSEDMEFAHTEGYSEDEDAAIIGLWNPTDFEHDALKWALDYYGCQQYRFINKNSQKNLTINSSNLAVQSVSTMSWYLEGIENNGSHYFLRKKGTMDYLFVDTQSATEAIDVRALESSNDNFKWLLFALDEDNIVEDLLFRPSVIANATQSGLECAFREYMYYNPNREDRPTNMQYPQHSLERTLSLPSYVDPLKPYTLQFTGYINIPNTAYYDFDVTSPTNSEYELYIDNIKVSHVNSILNAEEIETVGLAAGMHEIHFTFGQYDIYDRSRLNPDEDLNTGFLSVSWEGAGISHQEISSQYFFRETLANDSNTAFSDLNHGGEYWQYKAGLRGINNSYTIGNEDGPDLLNSLHIGYVIPDGVGRFTDFDNVISNLPNGHVALFKGWFNATESRSSNYTFEISNDEKCRLYIGGELILDHTGANYSGINSSSSTILHLEPGLYETKVEYYGKSTTSMNIDVSVNSTNAALQLYGNHREFYYRSNVLISPTRRYGDVPKGIPFTNYEYFNGYERSTVFLAPNISGASSTFYRIGNPATDHLPNGGQIHQLHINKIADKVYTIKRRFNSDHLLTASDGSHVWESFSVEEVNPYWNFEKINRGIYTFNPAIGDGSSTHLIEEVAADTMLITMSSSDGHLVATGSTGTEPYDRNNLDHHWLVNYSNDGSLTFKNAASGGLLKNVAEYDIAYVSAAPDIVKENVYTIVSMNKGKQFNIWAYNMNNNARIMLHDLGYTTSNEKFKLHYYGANRYLFKSVLSDKNISYNGYSIVQTNQIDSARNYLWYLKPVNEYNVFQIAQDLSTSRNRGYIHTNKNNIRLNIADNMEGDRSAEFQLLDPQVDLTELLAHYPLDTDATDATGHNFDGVLKKGVSFVTDQERGQVASFDGKNDYIELYAANELDMSYSSFTVSAWVKLDRLNNADQSILGSQDVGNEERKNKVLHLIVRDQKTRMGFYGNDLASNTVIDPQEWHQIVFRYNIYTRERSVFVDGELDITQTDVDPYIGSTMLTVGRWKNRNGHLKGLMDDLKIWRHAISDEAVEKDFWATSTQTDVNLKTGMVTSLQQIEEVQSMVLYPNPTDNSISVDLYLEAAGIVKTKIVDLLGRSMDTQTLELEQGNHTINLKDLKTTKGLNSGMYILILESKYWTGQVKFLIK